jgi:hypothetical protein
MGPENPLWRLFGSPQAMRAHAIRRTALLDLLFRDPCRRSDDKVAAGRVLKARL